VPFTGKLSLNRPLMGTNTRFTSRGLAGHTTVKTLMRTGRGIGVGIHLPDDFENLAIMECQSARLLHFDGLTPLHWLVKRLRYAALPHADKKVTTDSYRWAQIAELRNMRALWEARRFQRRLTALRPERIAQLEALRLLERADGFDPAGALAAILPGREVDLSVKRFNRRLKRRDAAFIEAMALENESS